MSSPDSHYPAGLARREFHWLKTRRAKTQKERDTLAASAEATKVDETPLAAGERPAHICGVALSGGGQRSATFCIGVLQALARRKLLAKVDYLSGVSGGNYACSFLGGWISRKESSVEEVEKELKKLRSPQLDFLRENGRFLAPNGAGDAWTAAVVHLRNWISMMVVLGTLVLGVFMVSETAKQGLHQLHPMWMPGISSWPIGKAEKEATATDASTAKPAKPAKAEKPPELAIVMSPFWRPAAYIIVLGAVPLAFAYWLVYPRKGRPPLAFFLPPLALVYLGGAAALNKGLPDFLANRLWLCAVVLILTVGWCLWADYRQRLKEATPVVGSCAAYVAFWGMAILLAWVLGALGPGGVLLPPLPDFVAETPARWVALLVGMLAAFIAVVSAHRAVAANPWWISKTAKRLALYVFYRGQTVQDADFGAARSGLTSFMALTGLAGVTLAGVALLDSVAQSLVLNRVEMTRWIVSLISPAAVLALLRGKLTKFLAHDEGGGESSSLVLTIAIWVGAGIVLAASLVGVALAARMWALYLCSISSGPGSLGMLSAATAGMLVLSWVLGRRLEFVNLSAQHNLYASRLTRAYLGASNALRHGATKDWQVTETLPNDHIEFGDYRPQANGGPLHLINVTVNETVSGVSHVEQRDRKGLSMAIGPAGISVRAGDHAIFTGTSCFEMPRCAVLRAIDDRGTERKRRFHALGQRPPGREQESGESEVPTTVEMPPIGAWMGISGAAFTTGLGARTSLATSLLLGLFNVRLGYWWDSGIVPHRRVGVARRTRLQKLGFELAALFPAQVAFADEMLARFHGLSRRYWYLSDGGHFENTACYELIRRRMPFIVCCDCGCDPETTFEDVANLVRKARLDFDAEIEFLNGTSLGGLSEKAKKLIGPLSALRTRADEAEGQKLSKAHAALARITYTTKETGWLLLIKPTLTAGLARDVLHYASQNPPFPQQTTMDQFFDEAQWESYRRLGWEIGSALFAIDELQPRDGEEGWRPDFAKLKIVPDAKEAEDEATEKIVREVLARVPGLAQQPKGAGQQHEARS